MAPGLAGRPPHREIPGWRLSSRDHAKTAEAGLEDALINRFGHLGRTTKPIFLRSDNGLAFTSKRYTDTFRKSDRIGPGSIRGGSFSVSPIKSTPRRDMTWARKSPRSTKVAFRLPFMAFSVISSPPRRSPKLG
mgnify:CR=1 FL=1